MVLLAALLSAGLAARLGVWQLDRAAQKQALQVELDTRSVMPVLSPGELATTPEAATAQYQRRVELRGVWLDQATVFLDNRQMNARQGFFVMTPLRLLSGPGQTAEAQSPAALIWVQRGWAARDNNDRSLLPQVSTPQGVVEINGRVAPPPARLFEFDSQEVGAIRQNLDLAASARELGQPVLPMTVLQTDEPLSGADGLARQWPAPSVDIQKHYGYAFQWFALCALIIGLYLWFQIIRPNWHKKRETV